MQCWGADYSGQLALGPSNTTAQLLHPSGVVMDSVVRIAAGSLHTCVIVTGGGVWCWGSNNVGQLGLGSMSSLAIPSPSPTVNLSDAIGITAGDSHTCALVSGGNVFCWGDNTYGQLGSDTTVTARSRPTAVALSNVTQIAAGGSFVCAILVDGELRCWGSNEFGQLGIGNMINVSSLPVRPLLTGVVTGVAAGSRHTCAILVSNRDLLCWGDNYFGQLGTGDTVSLLSPATTAVLSGVRQVVAAATHTCALSDGASGEVRCWGSNENGELGVGVSANSSAPSTSSVTLSDVVGLSVDTLALHTCAILAPGGIMCWGYNVFGQLGVGTTESSFIPLTVSGLAL